MPIAPRGKAWRQSKRLWCKIYPRKESTVREHVLTAEPFLIIGLIAAIRRILVLTAGFTEMPNPGEITFRIAMPETGVLTGLIPALVASLFLLSSRTSAGPLPASRRGGSNPCSGSASLPSPHPPRYNGTVMAGQRPWRDLHKTSPGADHSHFERLSLCQAPVRSRGASSQRCPGVGLCGSWSTQAAP